MKFALLTHPEIEGAPICWSDVAVKSPELVAAALAARFSEWEVWESLIGVLQQDWVVSRDWAFSAGARALIGLNGSALLELSGSSDAAGRVDFLFGEGDA